MTTKEEIKKTLNTNRKIIIIKQKKLYSIYTHISLKQLVNVDVPSRCVVSMAVCR